MTTRVEDSRRRARRRPIAVLAALAVVLAAAVAIDLALRGDEGDPAPERQGIVADIRARPEYYEGRTVVVAGVVRRVEPGAFLVARGESELLAVPGLRERRVRVKTGDAVRVVGRIRVVDPPSEPRAAPFPDYDGRAVIVPQRVERAPDP